MTSIPKRKIAIVITHRAPYGRLKPVLRAIARHPDLELQIIVGTPMNMHHFFFALRHGEYKSLLQVLPWHVKARLKTLLRRGDVSHHELLTNLIKKDGFHIDRYLPMFLDGGDLATMLKVQANVLFGLPTILKELKPDILVVHADRFEMLPVAMVGAMLNIPVAHTQGGDVSGTIDESIRHAITKLAHIHFPTTEESRKRLIQMGENPHAIVMTGCPTIDGLKALDLRIDEDFYARVGTGYGDTIDLKKPFIMVLQHPVTSEYADSRKNMETILAALEAIDLPTLLFSPNIDGGSDGASAAVREFLSRHTLTSLSVYKHFNADDFLRALNAASVALGNSSSFIREGSYLGVPAVIVGTRQDGRERADNVMHVDYVQEEIVSAIERQRVHGVYPKSALYGDGTASEKIATALATMKPPSVQKTFRSFGD
ncbi:MAG: UDP-N-acetylglucosamine 2-epimerase [Minisyncoccia bacterium]